MTFLSAVYTLLIGPLELFFEVLYSISYRIIGHPGTAIICLSLAMNFLVLPLYMRADEIQNEQIEREKKLQPWIKHIKKNFKGDERFMILQTFYRQNNYKPTQILRGSVSLLLEIPFFIAAYRFLSGLTLLNGVSFGPIGDLGSPDGLINIGGLSINLLPILMTVINIISSRIYCKDAPLKSKLQLYGIAIIFLVLLYNSPAGLVFYWTLNNLFSLCKNIVYELRSKRPAREKETEQEDRSKGLFYTACVFLSLFIGLLIPSMVVKSSPSEFIDSSSLTNPTAYIIKSLLIAIGIFVIWFGVFYNLGGARFKKGMTLFVWIASGVSVVNFMFFGTELGTMSAELVYDKTPKFSAAQVAISLVVMLLVAIVFYFCWRKAFKASRLVCTAAVIAIAIMSVMNISGMQDEIKKSTETLSNANKGTPHLTLSKEGQNVVIIMMDRAITKS